MTLQQLEYAVAVGQYGSFVTAAEKCFVTQPTLSMQVKKLEEEAGITLFDRSRQPVAVTDAGKVFLEQAKVVLRERNRLSEVIASTKDDISGELHIAIIPTLAPYLLPLFVDVFSAKFPLVHLTIDEMPTTSIIAALRQESIDCGILATPLHEDSLTEINLFNEPFVAYLSKKNPLWNKRQLKTEDLNVNDVLLLADGHCMRNQVMNLCARRKERSSEFKIDYRSGSIETLRRLVELGEHMTIIPYLAVAGLSAKQQEAVRYFRSPEPAREISIVTHRAQLKKALIDKLAESILGAIPKQLKRSVKQHIIPLS
ncbi:MAG: LysR family transcriptional regulator [Bacteroidetes bacterium]|nr:LysR family transcriptional regulator [Bacteroidota bacterium]